MKFKFVLGVDISKNWFNFCLMTSSFEILFEGQIDNTPQAIDDFLQSLYDQGFLDNMNQIILVMEYTGIYVQHLKNSWLAHSGQLTLVHASKVSDLLAGLPNWEEKTDQMDARRLAEYAFRYADKLMLWEPQKFDLPFLQALQRQRARTIQALNSLEVPIRESSMFDDQVLSKMLRKNHQKVIIALNDAIKTIDKKLNDIITAHYKLKLLFKYICSVEGVGPVTAREIIIATSAFEDFLPHQAKAFARYCGVVPLQKQSGKVKRRRKNSKKANMKMKTLLTMGATSLIRSESDLGKYYRRKIEEGKAHFSVINAMRNKMILRIFAVVRNQVMYQKKLNLSLEKP